MSSTEVLSKNSKKLEKGFRIGAGTINTEGAPPKELTYAELIKQVGEQQSAYDALKKRKTVAVEAQWDKAEKGDNQSFNTLLDRLEGKAKQGVEIGGTDGGAIKIEIEMI